MGTNEYLENTKKLIEENRDFDMSTQYELFLKYMPKKGKVLDLGCGFGENSLHFQDIGYDVVAVDPVDEFLNHAKTIGVKKKIKLNADELNYTDEFDGIWANESLLHVASKKINAVLKKCARALKRNGVFYCSFKYETFEGEKTKKYYVNQTESSILSYLKDTGLVFALVNMSDDVRDNRTDRWLNAVLVKTGE